MKNRSVPMVIIVGLLTFGIYYLIWLYQTRAEMLEKDPSLKISSIFFILIPFIGIFLFLWSYAGAAAKVTNEKYSQAVAFILLLFLSSIGAGLLQGAYNEVPGGSA